MKKITRLNYQLFLTVCVIIIGSIVVFCTILPSTMRYFFDNRIFNHIVEVQSQLGQEGLEKYNGYDGIYHILYSQLETNIDEDITEDLLHQRLMYKEFFLQLDDKAVAEQKPLGMYKYVQGHEVIYYVINTQYEGDILISYKIETNYSMLSNQLFMNVLMIIGITIGIILLIFYKWNARLINNLKDIQFKLDEIGEGNLNNPIKTDHYTAEFQEVMTSLETMRQKLYENDQVKQDMIHNISHDLKTPLSVIKNYAEGIIDAVYPYGTVEETAHVIYDQADRLQRRVQSLLYLNRLEYIKSQKEIPDTFKMKDLVLEVVGYMQDREEPLGIESDLDESYFLGDTEKWRIVIENLLDNAKRYAKSQIRIMVREGIFSMYNDGPTIEASINGSLFNPFEVGKGGVTGLGLSIVKKTVELYQYEITFVNERGGVTFKITKQIT